MSNTAAPPAAFRFLQTMPIAPETANDLDPTVEATTWGPAQRIAAPLVIEGIPLRWDHPARPLGTDRANW